MGTEFRHVEREERGGEEATGRWGGARRGRGAEGQRARGAEEKRSRGEEVAGVECSERQDTALLLMCSSGSRSVKCARAERQRAHTASLPQLIVVIVVIVVV